MNPPEPVATPMPKTWGIVLAAGGGSRFGGPKQFRSADGHRLVDMAVATVAAVCDSTVLVLPPDHTWDGASVDVLVEGGVDRGDSVRRGLAAISDEDGIVLVHQAANPLASVALCHTLFVMGPTRPLLGCGLSTSCDERRATAAERSSAAMTWPHPRTWLVTALLAYSSG